MAQFSHYVEITVKVKKPDFPLKENSAFFNVIFCMNQTYLYCLVHFLDRLFFRFYPN